ncbi:MAG: outer membrane protein OmpA-like peptidoglycan-associated protein [Pirellulaceae bacterium]|jgi:outer membrane protein OmpA-like peptidoglycan-associated protein
MSSLRLPSLLLVVLTCVHTGCGLTSKLPFQSSNAQNQQLVTRAQLAQDRAEQLAQELQLSREKNAEAELALARAVKVNSSRSLAALEKIATANELLRFDHEEGIARFVDTIRFGDGDVTLTPVENGKLRKLLSLLESDAGQELRVVVTGHGDPHATEEANWLLSSQRAAAVAGFMKRNGISSERLRIVGSAPSDEVSVHTQPRRAEIFLVKPETRMIGWADSMEHLYR